MKTRRHSASSRQSSKRRQAKGRIAEKAPAALPRRGNLGLEGLETRQLLSGGMLDESFGTGGIVLHDHNATNNYGAASVALAGGKFLVAGTYGPDYANDIAVSRYNADGSLDTSFGVGGFAVLDLGSEWDGAYAMTIDADGKIVVVGQIDGGETTMFDMAVARFNPDGSVDTSFGGGDGVATVDFAGSFDLANSVTVLADGKILVGGSAAVGDTGAFALARLNADGSLDAKSYADLSDGFVFRTGGSFAMAVTGSHVVLAGYANFTDWSNADAALVWFDLGSLSYVSKSMYEWGGDNDVATAMKLDADGNLVVAGYSEDFMTGTAKYAVMRVFSGVGGALDGSFNGGAVALATFDNGHDIANALAIQADGKIVLAGKANGMSNDVGIVRYNADGTLDTAFGDLGYVRIDAGGSDDSAYSLLAMANGKLVAVGTAHNGMDYDIVLVGIKGPNVDPVALTDGPYSGAEGSTISLSGAGSTDSDGSIVTYEWDFNYDGSNFDVDAMGMNAMFQAFNGPDMRTIALRVTDNLGGFHIVTTTVTVHDAAPVASVGGTQLVQKRHEASFVGSISDWADDAHEVKWDFGDGSGTDWLSSDTEGALYASHTYEHKGAYTVTFTVRDINSGAEHSACMQVEVTARRVFYDGALQALVVEGTEDGDSIKIHKNRETGQMEIFFNGVSEGSYDSQKLVVYGSGGDDLVRIADDMTDPVQIVGGDGNDMLVAGYGNATLMGGAGNDLLVGGEGTNLLDGGDGNDLLYVGGRSHKSATLLGGAGDDYMVGGGGSDLLEGGDGNDYLKGRHGKDVLKGGLGNDYYKTNSGDTVIDPDMTVKKPKSKR